MSTGTTSSPPFSRGRGVAPGSVPVMVAIEPSSDRR
jgi:hypothetical protein